MVDAMVECLGRHFTKAYIEDQSPNTRAFFVTLGPRAGSVLVIESPEGLAIVGDMAPGHNGIVSAFGLGLEWFGRAQSGDYLCSKFLAQEFNPRRAAASLREWQTRLESDEVSRKRLPKHFFLCEIEEYAQKVEEGYESQADVVDWLEEHGEEGSLWSECMWDYNDNDAARLIAIQSAFARLWQAREVSRG